MRRSIQLNGAEIERTPLLVPSFSSKGVPDNIGKIVRTTKEYIDGPILVSAYDLHYRELAPPFDFSSLVFLDSGGYEASRDSDLSDSGEGQDRVRLWSADLHRGQLDQWDASSPTVLISYDHPLERVPLDDQIARAKELFAAYPGTVHEFLIKPENNTRAYLQMEAVKAKAHSFADFDIIGVTEKEIGNSIHDRMKNIADLRKELTRIGLELPIHVFGSLDTVATPLYFLAGADIFDGLTWLRFAYRNGLTLYRQNYGAFDLGISTRAHMIDGRCWSHNYGYLRDLELEMRRFLKAHDYQAFQHHAELFAAAAEAAREAVRD